MLDVVAFRPGRRMWTFPGGGDGPAVLLWHGSGEVESDVLAPLAAAVATQGPTVFVPDWRFADDDHGRADLLASVEFARAQRPDLVLAGWSLGAAAAAGVVLSLPEVPVRAVVGLAGGFGGREPISGELIPGRANRWPAHVPCLLVHGTDDEVVPVAESRDFAAAVGPAARLVELPGLHAHVVGAAFDPTVGRCLPSADPLALALRTASVEAILAAVGES